MSEDEYHDSGERIASYLAQEDAPVRRWDPPEMDARRAEAEWGWDPALGEDIVKLADRYDYRVRRLVTGEPQQHSGFVADLHRWWYGEVGRPTDRLLVESYVQWDPMWALRTGSVPYWVRFNMEPSFEELTRYLEAQRPVRGDLPQSVLAGYRVAGGGAGGAVGGPAAPARALPG